MELPLALAIGLLFAGAVYSILRPNLVRMVIGVGLLANATNLTMVASGGFRLENAPPFVFDPERVAGLMDPLPPDIVLTAIVISFAVGALFLTICYLVYSAYGSENPEELPLPANDDDSFEPRRPQRLRYDE